MKYRALVSWSICAEYEVEADSAEEAQTILYNNVLMESKNTTEGLVSLGEDYIDDSFSIDKLWLEEEEEAKEEEDV